MTKEDKQIIKRATKETWRTGDRSRLKRLLKKNLELYRENIELKKENEHLRNNGFTVSAMTEQQLKVALEKGEELEKENAELKETVIKMNNVITKTFSNLTKAKEIIREIMKYDIPTLDYVKAEQFLKEIEK